MVGEVEGEVNWKEGRCEGDLSSAILLNRLNLTYLVLKLLNLFLELSDLFLN